eukprot:sb/3472558/
MVRTGLLDKQLGYLAVYRDQRDGGSSTMKCPDYQQQSGTGARLGTAMAAAALQQHLSMSLGLSTRPRPARRRGPPPSTNNRNNKTSDREYVLEAAPPAPTLAQRYGLATPPPSQLTEQDWARVKETSNRRGDSSAPCVICKEEFTQCTGQVLLSCSQVLRNTQI